MTHDSPPPAYLRQPALHGDTLVFVSDDDLWRACTTGGTATRLTAGLSEPATPALSADGRWLAWAGRDEQHAEVWLMPTAGGPARRLTWLGSEGAVRGFLPDGRVLFCSNHGQPFLRNLHAWAVSPEGGLPERLPLGQVNHLAFGPAGARVIGRNTADPARWKRYRGGTAGQLWVDADGSGAFRRLPLPGNPTSPMWLGERLWFLGDHEGIGNLYSCAPDGSDLRRHTDHDTFYARHASSDGRRIVYQCGAELWLFDPAGGRSQRLEIVVPSARTQAARRFVAAEQHLHGVHLHPQGHKKVARRRIAWTVTRWGRPSCYPDESPAGPVVALTNEHAGSDGDIFSHGFKLMRIGRLVGRRTWGGVVGIWPRHHLIDGSETTQPEYAFWFKDVGFAVENHGTEPDLDVDNAPQDDAFNAPERDRQLAAALAEALAAVQREGVYRPEFGPRPRLGR